MNGVPYQGVDSNHKEVFFDLKSIGSNLKLDFRLWSGLEGGGEPQVQYHQIKEAFISCLDRATDDLYYLGKNIVNTLKILDDNNYHRHNLEKILIKTMQIVDFTNERSEEFYNLKQGKWEPSGSMWVEADCNRAYFQKPEPEMALVYYKIYPGTENDGTNM